MGETIPLSAGSPSNAAGFGEMVRVVVRRLGNGVDCLRRVEKVPRPATFPADSRLLDMDDVRVRDLVTMGFGRAGVELSDDATVMGCAYEVGDETHKCAWICDGEAAASDTVVSRVAGWLRNSSASRRAMLAALLAAVYMIPSPFEWGEVIASAAPMVRMVTGATICDSAEAATVPEPCRVTGPLCNMADVNGQ
ncbi:hypothetical protein BcepIL02_gp27 [Burkholderia phage BcepIL02]|uniref:Uncharacterized protein n=1 Tax=Burkholderia phage BcepIL02 TaxID=2886898 RepID=C5IHL9_9CAUD|nr:hypothetical protein BcepIL02_gp27 [Burkholderia phage BcepIL02]ACR15020.1 hypothetical protein BcepIL02_gp27 [Burkholderia phage BcepIL02]